MWHNQKKEYIIIHMHDDVVKYLYKKLYRYNVKVHHRIKDYDTIQDTNNKNQNKLLLSLRIRKIMLVIINLISGKTIWEIISVGHQVGKSQPIRKGLGHDKLLRKKSHTE